MGSLINDVQKRIGEEILLQQSIHKPETRKGRYKYEPFSQLLRKKRSYTFQVFIFRRKMFHKIFHLHNSEKL